MTDKWKKPRAWADPEGCSSTMVLYDPRERGGPGDSAGIYMHTNLGWLGPLENEPEEGETLEQVAENIAKGYKLEEVDRERAIWMAGCEGLEDRFE